jgi:hypothetical protein
MATALGQLCRVGQDAHAKPIIHMMQAWHENYSVVALCQCFKCPYECSQYPTCLWWMGWVCTCARKAPDALANAEKFYTTGRSDTKQHPMWLN